MQAAQLKLLDATSPQPWSRIPKTLMLSGGAIFSFLGVSKAADIIGFSQDNVFESAKEGLSRLAQQPLFIGLIVSIVLLSGLSLLAWGIGRSYLRKSTRIWFFAHDAFHDARAFKSGWLGRKLKIREQASPKNQYESHPFSEKEPVSLLAARLRELERHVDSSRLFDDLTILFINLFSSLLIFAAFVALFAGIFSIR